MTMDKLNNISVLIVEDDKINRQVLNILLTKAMNLQHIEEWADSDQFLERMKQLHKKPDLIIMDIMIDPIDGFEMFTQLRSDPQYDAIKVIAHTAGVMDEQVSRMQALKFDGLISKPITREIFPQLVRRIMKGESIWYVS